LDVEGNWANTRLLGRRHSFQCVFLVGFRTPHQIVLTVFTAPPSFSAFYLRDFGSYLTVFLPPPTPFFRSPFEGILREVLPTSQLRAPVHPCLRPFPPRLLKSSRSLESVELFAPKVFCGRSSLDVPGGMLPRVQNRLLLSFLSLSGRKCRVWTWSRTPKQAPVGIPITITETLPQNSPTL